MIPNQEQATAPDQNGRLRTHPVERFAGNHHCFDLQEELNKLRAEAEPPNTGRHQVTLLHHGPVAQVLFSFEAGGEMPTHSTHGWVNIHIVEGEITVAVEDHSHTLGAGQILVMDPQVPHSLRANERSAMLLTVHIQVEGKPTPLTLGPNE